MHDRLTELETFARPLDLQRYRRPLVWAPHPDDEVFGCGGLLALWQAAGVQATVVLVTDGQAQPGDGAGAHARVDESRSAAQTLGHRLECWGDADRALRCDEALIARVQEQMQALQPDVVLCPALCEPHPDHQALTLAVACATARLPASALPDVLLYESGGALTHADTLVDISSVLALKERALQAFASQEAAQPYKSRIQARDHFRAMTLGPQAQAAEAFQTVACATAGWPAWVPALEPLFLHARGQAAVPQDLPLVSVMVRTVGDAHLARTLASVCAQTYPRLELVVVAAHGQAQPPSDLPQRPGLPLRWVQQGRALNRPQAANAALDAAQGDLLIFLDDDDLWTPEHVHKLVAAYRGSGTVMAVHTDVRVIDEHGQERTRYDQPFVPARLAFTNVFPIHSVLFERQLVSQRGCRFDEALPVLEDWDFWLQVTAHTPVLHVPGVSALYRWRDRSGLEDEDSRHHHKQWRDRVQARWLQQWPQETLLQAIRWYTAALDDATQRVAVQARRADEQQLLTTQQARLTAEQAQAAQTARDEAAVLAERAQSLHAELQAAGQRLGQAVHDATAAQEQALAERLAREALAVQLAEREGALREQREWAQRLQALAEERLRQSTDLQASTSWRITRPLRWLGAKLRGRAGGPSA
jgi:LmbE family N-acetylglucosaminyl deacetylase